MYLLMLFLSGLMYHGYIARNLIEADAADDMRRVCMYVRVCI
jgi:hypothetical protein